MLNYKTKKEEGFTIIEVLIVLAIAGLIMLVVFLAVPNLQRSQRNNSYKSEAQQLLGAASEVSSNANGRVLVAGDSAAVLAAANAKNYTTLTIEGEAGTSVPNTTYTSAVFRTAAKCNAAGNETDAGSNRQIALLYRIETAGGSQILCQEG